MRQRRSDPGASPQADRPGRDVPGRRPGPTEPPAVIRQFAAVAGDPDLPAASDHNAALGPRYQVATLSTLIVIDPAGTVTHRAVHPTIAPTLAAIANATRP